MADTTNIIRVGTYNTGDFSGENVPAGSEKAKEVFREVIQSNNVAFWALQEDVGYFNEETNEMPYEAVYDGYQNYARYGHQKYNYKAFLTDLPLGEVEQVYYTGEMKYGHPWFLHTQLSLNGKDICVICLHFDWADRYRREEQIKQVIQFASKYEYSMILGDFNPENYLEGVLQSNPLMYEYDLNIFRQAGFHIANADKFGIFTTYVASLPDFPCDNIAVSTNIKIHNVGRIYREWMNDHAALWADIEIL